MNDDSISKAPVPDLGSRERVAQYAEALSKWQKNLIEAEYARYRTLVGPRFDEFLRSKDASLDGLRQSDPVWREAALFVLDHAFEKSMEIVKICEAILGTDPDETVRIAAMSYIDAYRRGSGKSPSRWLAVFKFLAGLAHMRLFGT